MKNIFKIYLPISFLLFTLTVDSFAFNKNEPINKSEETKSFSVELTPVSIIGEIEMKSHSSISPWAFPTHTLDIVDSYMPFIFRTKKSAALDELRVIISVNDKGRISGYEVLNQEADKGLVERVGYVVRNLPKAQAVPGFDNYDGMDFEMVIRR